MGPCPKCGAMVALDIVHDAWHAQLEAFAASVATTPTSEESTDVVDV